MYHNTNIPKSSHPKNLEEVKSGWFRVNADYIEKHAGWFVLTIIGLIVYLIYSVSQLSTKIETTSKENSLRQDKQNSIIAVQIESLRSDVELLKRYNLEMLRSLKYLQENPPSK